MLRITGLIFMVLTASGLCRAVDERQVLSLQQILDQSRARAEAELQGSRQPHAQGPINPVNIPSNIPSFPIPADVNPAQFAQGTDTGTITEIRGSIEIDRDKDDLPEFKIYYCGMETLNTTDGFYKFPAEAVKRGEFSLIVCNKIKHTFAHHNTVKSFGLIPDMNYRHMRATYNRMQRKWAWKEEPAQKNGIEIPADAVIIPINPAYVERIEETWPGNLGPKVFKMPRVVFKENCRKKIDRKAVKSVLHGLDMDTFHAKIVRNAKNIKEGTGEVSAPYQRAN